MHSIYFVVFLEVKSNFRFPFWNVKSNRVLLTLNLKGNYASDFYYLLHWEENMYCVRWSCTGIGRCLILI